MIKSTNSLTYLPCYDTELEILWSLLLLLFVVRGLSCSGLGLHCFAGLSDSGDLLFLQYLLRFCFGGCRGCAGSGCHIIRVVALGRHSCIDVVAVVAMWLHM